MRDPESRRKQLLRIDEETTQAQRIALLSRRVDDDPNVEADNDVAATLREVARLLASTCTNE